MQRKKLSESEIATSLKQIPGWDVSAEKLVRSYEFNDFIEAFAAMTKGAILSEKLNHHPEWSNVYRNLTVTLSTHDAGGLTELDFEWAKQFDRLVQVVARG